LNIKEYFVGIPITLAGAALAIVSLFTAYIPGYLILAAVIFLAYMMISNLRVRKF
jgi:phosphatidylserine synthase